MKKITSLQFTELTVTNFRNHTNPQTYLLSPKTCVSGQNGCGKTTMAHGIAFALFGTAFDGERDIGRLLNESAKETEVKLSFLDQDGAMHFLVRKRTGKNSSILFDGFTIRQNDIDQMICDKQTFLSMFNPVYLLSMGEKGRELVLSHLKPISYEQVLQTLPEHHQKVLKDIPIDDVSAALKNYRALIKQKTEQLIFLRGSEESIHKSIESSEQKILGLQHDLIDTKEKLQKLKDKQFTGIDVESLRKKYNELTQDTKGQLSDLALLLIDKLNCFNLSDYELITLYDAKKVLLSERYSKLKEQLKTLSESRTCPLCRSSDFNVKTTAQALVEEMEGVTRQAKEIINAKLHLIESVNQAKASISDTILKLSILLDRDSSGVSTQDEANRILEQLKFGNLSGSEVDELSNLEADIISLEAQIKSLNEYSCGDLETIADQKNVLNNEIFQYNKIIASLNEFSQKRTELLTAPIQMNNVEIKLTELVPSTGELKNVFKFTYKGRDIAFVSETSELILAGIEITAMMRKLTGVDCPLCIDNTESISAFNSVPLPSQILLLKHIPNRALTVSDFTSHTQNISNLKKAG